MEAGKYKRMFEDLDVWLKQTSGFGENIDLENYDSTTGDIHESYIKIYVDAGDMPATIIKNRCKESIIANTYMGDQLEVHPDYLEVTKGSTNKDLQTTIIPYDKITCISTYSGVIKK